jgi:hypothetical protein
MRRGNGFRFFVGGLLAGVLPGLCFAQQQIISAQSGTVQYVEGTVFAGGQRVERKFGQFPSLQPGEELRSADGRAEVLLTPGAFLRLSDYSAVRMVSNRLVDTRVEALNGSVMVECDELLKDNAVTLIFKDDNIQLEKRGLYRLDTDSGKFMVYSGEAVIHSASGETRLQSGKEATLNGTLAAQHFNPKQNIDDFYEWSSQRSSNLAYATVTASQSVLNAGTPWYSSGWMWSGLLDEWTFLPGTGLLFSPFGWGFWSPLSMGYYYTPVYYGGGTSGIGNTGAGFTGRNGATTGRGATGTSVSTNTPKPHPPVPMAVLPGATRTGASYGGIAAALPRSYGGFGGSRSGLGGNSGYNGGGIGLGSAASSSSSGGFHGGGFGGGHGGGGHR